MRCPIDGTELQPTDRNGIEIDYCPRCRGVWLDRNELEKILERSAGLYQPQSGQYPPQQQGHYPPQQPGHYPPQQQPGHYPPQQQGHYDPYSHKGKHKKREREGFLDDLFDF